MSGTPARLLALLSLLQARRDWPGRLLADRLEVSERTVRRDVDRLREMGYPVGVAMGPDGGYRLAAGADLPPLLFDDDQAVAIAVALREAATSGAAIGDACVRALATVRQVLPARLRHRVDAVAFATLPGDRPGEPVDTEVLVAISRAVQAREGLRFDYVVPQGDPSPEQGPTPPRRAEPHHLLTRAGRWYLVAWDLDRGDWRTFRVDRIDLRTPDGPRFTPRELPGGGDVETFVAARSKGSAGADRWPCRGEVVLHLPYAEVAPYVDPGAAQAIGPDRTRLRVGAWSWAGLVASLGRFGAELDVVGPPALRRELAASAERYLRAAADGPPAQVGADGPSGRAGATSRRSGPAS